MLYVVMVTALVVLGLVLRWAFTVREVDWGLACGRYYLSIDGLVVAVEADICRDGPLRDKFSSRVWTRDMIQFIAENPREAKRLAAACIG